MLFYWIKVLISVQKSKIIMNAECSYQYIYRLPYSYAFLPKDSVIHRAFDSQFLTNHIHKGEFE